MRCKTQVEVYINLSQGSVRTKRLFNYLLVYHLKMHLTCERTTCYLNDVLCYVMTLRCAGECPLREISC